LGVPLLLRGDSHDLFRPPGFKSNLARWARSLLFRRFAAFLAVGRANAEYFRHCGVPEARIHFVPHCVDNQRFQDAAPQAALDAAAWRAELGIAANACVVLFAGKFEPKKRSVDLLTAFGIAQEEMRKKGEPAPVLLFVGSGPLERELRAASGDRIGQTVFFAPFQNQTRMPTVYAMGDLFVLPSYGVGETWGLAINEAMNLAMPVIVSTHVGCGPDLVQQGDTGWVFKAGDIDALAATIVQALLLDSRHRAQMGLAARERVGDYSYSAATTGLLATLSTLAPRAPDSVRG
jgi:glycosyltransferase involved in cell wall biosynthesis